MAYIDPETYVYLDWAATAPLSDAAAHAMQPFLLPGRANVACGTNANSLHSPGRAAFAALEDARRRLARLVGVSRTNELIFTSGATESDNAALFGIAHGAVRARKQAGKACECPHIITTEIEHEAVQEVCARLERSGFRLTRLSPDRHGFISPAALMDALDADTVLVSVQAANSEIGSVQPVQKLAEIAHAHGAFFHTDATQALGKITVDVSRWGVDAASFSAHKIGGPKGIGALYLRSRTPFEAYLLGGGQEEARRSGTQNVCGAVGFAAACESVCEALDVESARERALCEMIYAGLLEHPQVVRTIEKDASVLRDAPGVTFSPNAAANLGACANPDTTANLGACANPDTTANLGAFDNLGASETFEHFLPNIVHVCVRGMESQTLIIRLDALGFAVSGGSACASSSLEPSHTLLSLGIPRDLAQGALRISIGSLTTERDARAFIDAFGRALAWE